MLKSLFIAVVMSLGFGMIAMPASAQVYVQIGPPAPIVERIPARPGSGYVWVGGYYRWYGGRYVWTHGYWSRHAGRWCGGRWVHTMRRGWHWTTGRWC